MTSKKSTYLAVIAVLLSPMAANADPIIDDSNGLADPDILLTFEEIVLATDSAVTSEYSGFGVTFSGLFYDSSCCIEFWTPDGDSPYLANVTTDTNIFGDFSILFSGIVSEASFTSAYNFESNSNGTLSAYLDGVLVESLNFGNIQPRGGWGYYGFENILFDELRAENVVATLIDELQYSVPEPSTFALIGMGLAATGLSRRRKIG